MCSSGQTVGGSPEFPPGPSGYRSLTQCTPAAEPNAPPPTGPIPDAPTGRADRALQKGVGSGESIAVHMYANIYHVNLQELESIQSCIYCCAVVQLTVRSIVEYVTKSTALSSILGIRLPIPRVCTSLDLLWAPSPLVVYAATETEYVVSGFRPPIISSCGGNTSPLNMTNSPVSTANRPPVVA